MSRTAIQPFNCNLMTQMACFVERRSLRHYLRAQSQGYHTIDRQGVGGGGGGRRRNGMCARRSSLKRRERVIVNQANIRTVSKATLGKFLIDGVERIWVFPSA